METVETEVMVKLVSSSETGERMWILPSGFKGKTIRVCEDHTYEITASYDNEEKEK